MITGCLEVSKSLTVESCSWVSGLKAKCLNYLQCQLVLISISESLNFYSGFFIFPHLMAFIVDRGESTPYWLKVNFYSNCMSFPKMERESLRAGGLDRINYSCFCLDLVEMETTDEVDVML